MDLPETSSHPLTFLAVTSSARAVANSVLTVASSCSSQVIRCSKWAITACESARNSGSKTAIYSGGIGDCDGDMAEMSIISPRARSHLSCPGYPAL